MLEGYGLRTDYPDSITILLSFVIPKGAQDYGENNIMILATDKYFCSSDNNFPFYISSNPKSHQGKNY